jgi:fibronectin-binding autotransporter adhesin
VVHRCSTLLTVMAAVSALGLGLRPLSTRADGIVNYTLTATNGLPAPTGPPPGTPSVSNLSSTETSGSATVAVPSTTGIAVGYQVTGTGIPTGTTVAQIGSGGSQLTLSQSATVSGVESLTYTPNIAPPQVAAVVTPYLGVVQPALTSATGPLTILAGSQGFNSTGVYDYLAKGTENGNPVQVLGLSFYGQGLASKANGGILNFSLDVANPSSPPQLLVSPTSGVSIALQTPDSSTGSSGNTGTGTTSGSGNVGALDTPEPLSVLVWSALAGAGMLRSRVLRKKAHQASHR